MKARESSRVREHGTVVTKTSEAVNPGRARIEAIRRIVETGSYAKVDGVMIDLFTASAIVKVYDALKQNQLKAKYRDMSVAVMADIAFKIMAKGG
jgi:hypothetical protein